MFKEKTCPNCMSLYRGKKCRNCDYINNEEKSGLRTVWKFIIILASLQLIIGTISKGFIFAFIVTLFAWSVLLLIPCVIRYVLKKCLSKKLAIIYTIISAVFLLFANSIISIIVNQTVTLWNLLMMIIPYYVLIDAPMFSNDK